MNITHWLTNNYIEVFGALTGIIYVFLEIRQNIWLWPVGLITSGVYVWVFFGSKFYADMSLQVYYIAISVLGWYWWVKGAGRRAQGTEQQKKNGGRVEEIGAKRRFRVSGKGRNGEGVKGRSDSPQLYVTRIKLKTGVILGIVFVILYAILRLVLVRFTDSPVPEWDSFITSLSIVATWMLARKIYEHWILWIVVNFASAAIFLIKGLYPTVVLYVVYGAMSIAGLSVWKKTIIDNLSESK